MFKFSFRRDAAGEFVSGFFSLYVLFVFSSEANVMILLWRSTCWIVRDLYIETIEDVQRLLILHDWSVGRGLVFGFHWLWYSTKQIQNHCITLSQKYSQTCMCSTSINVYQKGKGHLWISFNIGWHLFSYLCTNYLPFGKLLGEGLRTTCRRPLFSRHCGSVICTQHITYMVHYRYIYGSLCLDVCCTLFQLIDLAPCQSCGIVSTAAYNNGSDGGDVKEWMIQLWQTHPAPSSSLGTSLLGPVILILSGFLHNSYSNLLHEVQETVMKHKVPIKESLCRPIRSE